MEAGTATGAARCGAGGCREAKEALTDGELPVGLATKALRAVALLHEVAAGDTAASAKPDKGATVLAVDAGRAGKGWAFSQNVSASALAALHRETGRCGAREAVVFNWGSSRLMCRGRHVAGLAM